MRPLIVCLAIVMSAGTLSAEPQEKKAKPRANAQAKRPARRGRALLAIPDVARDQVICFALYTVHERTLKLTAQLYPLKDGESREVRLEIERDGGWIEVARARVAERGWAAVFRVENWDDTKTARYRVAHGEKARYEGTIRRNPVDKDEIVIAAFTGNSIHPVHGGDISRDDIVQNVQKIDADALFFSRRSGLRPPQALRGVAQVRTRLR